VIVFEVFRNGKKLCRAGVGEFGVLMANLTHVSHSPKKLARWKAEGRSTNLRNELYLHVGGIEGDDHSPHHVDWGNFRVKIGDEVAVRVLDGSNVNRARRRSGYQDFLEQVEADEKEYVREAAKKFGWRIDEKAALTKRKPKKTRSSIKRKPG
jgi:hypothetical protein